MLSIKPFLIFILICSGFATGQTIEMEKVLRKAYCKTTSDYELVHDVMIIKDQIDSAFYFSGEKIYCVNLTVLETEYELRKRLKEKRKTNNCKKRGLNQCTIAIQTFSLEYLNDSVKVTIHNTYPSLKNLRNKRLAIIGDMSSKTVVLPVN